MNRPDPAPETSRVRGQSAITNSAPLRDIALETAKLWRRHHLSYDQTKHVVEQTRRVLKLSPLRERTRTVKRLSHLEVERLIEHAYRRAPRYGLMLKTLFYSGARVSEFVNLRVVDLHLDLDPPQLRILQAKGGSDGYVPVLPSLAQELRTHLGGRVSGYLFESNRADRYTPRMVQRVARSAALNAGIEQPVTPHRLRASVATLLLDAGMPLDQVQKFLRHKRITTTQIYAETSIKNMGELPQRARAPLTRRMSDFPEGDQGSDRLPDGLGEAVVQRQFLLNDADLTEVARCRGPVNRLGFAVQLCTLRNYGFFLPHLGQVPDEVRDHLASQLGLLLIGLDGYPSDENTRHTHLERLRTYLGYVRCGEAERQRLAAHLGLMAQSTPRTEPLRQSAHAWLFAQRVVRPGRTTLRDLIASAREVALDATYLSLTQDLKTEQAELLDALLGAGDDQESAWPRSPIEALKLPAKKESADTVLFLLARLTTLLALGFSNWPALQTLPPEMRRQLRYGNEKPLSRHSCELRAA